MKSPLIIIAVTCLLLVLLVFDPQGRHPVDNLIIILGNTIIGWVAISLYFLGFLVAFKRNHKDCNAIFALNLLTGWTFVGWVISLVWALKVTENDR